LLVRYIEASETSNGPTFGVAALGQIHARPEVCVPLLVRLLDDKRVGVSTTATALAQFREQAAPSVSAVVRLLEGGPSGLDEYDKMSLVLLLDAIGPAAKEAIPILERMMSDAAGDDLVRFVSARALGAMGAEAVQALPALEAVLRMESVRPSGELAKNARESIARIRCSTGHK
jgi:HEAT repeat protein